MHNDQLYSIQFIQCKYIERFSFHAVHFVLVHENMYYTFRHFDIN